MHYGGSASQSFVVIVVKLRMRGFLILYTVLCSLFTTFKRPHQYQKLLILKITLQN